MKLLLDTHTFLWWANEPEKLSKEVTLCENAYNTLLLSVASVWEMQIKLQLGKLNIDIPLKELIDSQEKVNNLQVLKIDLKHVLALDTLPNHHKDPFDRLLIAQANVEDAFLISKDDVFSDYQVKLLW